MSAIGRRTRGPATADRRSALLAQSPAERVALVDDQHRLGSHVRRAADGRADRAVDDVDRAVEHRPDDALLPPGLSLGELAVFEQAGQLGAGAGTAWRA